MSSTDPYIRFFYHMFLEHLWVDSISQVLDHSGNDMHIELLRSFVASVSLRDDSLAYSHYRLGWLLSERHKATGQTQDLLDAKVHLYESINAIPETSQHLHDVLTVARELLVEVSLRLAQAYRNAYVDDPTQLENAVVSGEECLSLDWDILARTPSVVLDIKGYLSHLYHQRYVQTHETSNLDRGIALAREVDVACLSSKKEDMSILVSMATLLDALYSRQGISRLFSEAMAVVRRIEALEPAYPKLKGITHYFRSGLYAKRFALYRVQIDCNIAVNTARAGYETSHTSRRDDHTINLCTALYARGRKYGRSGDIVEAVSRIREHQRSHRHLSLSEDKYRPQFESLLGTLLATLFDRASREEAIKIHERIRDNSGPRNPDWPQQNWKLGRVYSSAGHFKKAQDCFELALRAIDYGRHEYARCCSDLGNCYTDLWCERSKGPQIIAPIDKFCGLVRPDTASGWDPVSDLMFQAAAAWAEALASQSGELFVRAHAGRKAAFSFLSFRKWKECYRAAWTTLQIIQQIVNRELSMEDFQDLMRGLSEVSPMATSAALHLGAGPLKALRILEFGRGVYLKQMMDLKDDFGRLGQAHPDLHRQLMDVQTALRTQDYRRTPSVRQALRRSEERIRQAERRKQVIQEIEQLPGFSNFNQPFSNDQLREVSRTGHIVIFNSPYAFGNPEPLEAFVIESSDNPRAQNITLPKLSLPAITAMAEQLVGADRLSTRGSGEARVIANEKLRTILEKLWTGVVHPIFQLLGIYSHHNATQEELPRVFWVSSGVMSMLPLHAAGLYDDVGESEHDATKYCVSSYAATIHALYIAYKQKKRRMERSYKSRKILLVAMPRNKGLPDLTNIEAELDDVKAIICNQSRPRTRSEEHINHSKDQVIPGIKDSMFAHFACHGISNAEKPSLSGLVLGTPTSRSLLSVHDLSEMNLEYAQLAYLSACSTAQNQDEGLVNEVLHVASAFQLAGFPQVIGTLWELRHDFAPGMTRSFYTHLRRRLDANGGDLQEDTVIRALHAAVQEQRDEEPWEFLNWISLVHIGH